MIDGIAAGRPVVAWYGDDFTGAAAVMEVLTFGGLPSVLFLDVPTQAQRDRFRGYGGIGIAGVARAKSPAWMDAALPPVFRFLDGLAAAITQYKVCSTFDSSPDVGSIGHAYDLAAPILVGAWTPLLAAPPPVNRYQVFGNLFASIGGVGYRLDRYPAMSRHPVTPMTEADLSLHLSRQTTARIGLIDIVAMRGGRASQVLAEKRAGGDAIVSLDVTDDETLREAGRLIWENRGARLFAIASQGLEYALLAHWHAAGLLPCPAMLPRAAVADHVAAVSGSCSPITAEQIAWAGNNGYRPIRLDVCKAVGDASAWSGELDRMIAASLDALSAGADPLLFTALGPDDPAVPALRNAAVAGGVALADATTRISEGLGHILAEVLRRTRIRRAIIAGGDTSSYATSALGVCALTAVAPTVAGAALFQAHADDDAGRTLEVALKGGQMGSTDYFGRIRAGV